MIFETVANLFYNIITGLLDGLSIPTFPEGIINHLSDYFSYIFQAAGLFSFLFPVTLFKVLIPIIAVLITSEYIYYFIMWILKKIPLAGIE